MAYNLQIVDETNGITANVKYENLSKPNANKPDIEAKVNGVIVKERTTYQGQVLGQGATQRQWTDDDGNVYSKAEVEFFYEGEPVEENSKTKVFHVELFEPVPNYIDKYVISKYYELFPSNDGHKKDFDREVAERQNLSQMYKLWKHLAENDLVARGEFCVSSKGFTPSAGYIRALTIDGNKWGLEVGLFKELKEFHHLQEGEPQAVQKSMQTGGKKRLKLSI